MHLNAIASVTANRLFPPVERENLIRVAREALVRSAPRGRAGEPAEPYLRSCISGALQHHLRDRVRLVHISRREHQQGCCLLEQLAAPEAEPAISQAINALRQQLSGRG